MVLTIPRILEITFYALANFLPYMALALYTFSRRLRYSKKTIVIMAACASLVQILTRFQAAYLGESNSVVTLIRLLSYAILFLFAFEVHWGKAIFILLIFSNISNFISITATFLETMIFPDEVHRLYCWHPAAIMLILHVFITIPLALGTKRWLKPLIERKPFKNEWNYLWLMPATFYLIWQYQVYGNHLATYDVVSNPFNIAFLFVVNLGGLLVYYTVVKLSDQITSNLELERLNRYLDIEKLEYQILHDRMEETRHARHDLRHHILAMSDYLENEEYDKLREYLDSYKKSVPEIPNYLFCKNRSVNRLLLFFATQARDHKIDFQVNVDLPENINIPEEDISVLLGNLLENALEACVEQRSSDRKIKISGKGNEYSFVFTIDNTCETEVKQTRNGDFISTKEHGCGIGLHSAKHIVERYNGVFEAEKRDNMFYVSFMLNL